MERHNTHLLSCSSSIEHSYKFDKNGLIISDSINNFGLAFNEISKDKNNKINIADIFKNLNKNEEIPEENRISKKEKEKKNQKNSTILNNNKDTKKETGSFDELNKQKNNNIINNDNMIKNNITKIE